MRAIDILRPIIHRHFGDEVPNPKERLAAFRAIIPGTLPDDYAEALIELRRATSLRFMTIVDPPIGKPHPRVPGALVQAGETPAVSVLYGLQESHTNVFEAWDWFADRMPPGLVPIGRDGSVSEICIDVSAVGNGRVFHWFMHGDPGPDDENGRPGWGNVFLLADSFTDFCLRLRIDDTPYEHPPGVRICRARP